MESKTERTAILYVHGKGGSAKEAEHYKTLFPEWDVYGLDYKKNTPWETKGEIQSKVTSLNREYDNIILVANSIGAFFSMNAKIEDAIKRAYLISPIVNMEKLIMDMMEWANVTEAELKEKMNITTEFGETLSWEYLFYVRSNPIHWDVPTYILYGEKDNLTSIETVTQFAEAHHANITVMPTGEHWFHTKEQMEFLDNWMKNKVH
ncbi:alpha/beta fold hydrolase [Anaerosporobacter faecicola]|uniref:alpha/beta fold hydrolase n=1 Tax=Anaerosporobacter faecicola TaxID=2718714 RepID=UPI00143B35FC|nr:alpha/beta hydrolase [Anaerosporobacter faecicola]